MGVGRLGALVLLICLCAGAGTAAAAVPAPARLVARDAPAEPRLGIAESYVAPDAAWALGARWERVIFQWSQIQPSGPSDWSLPTEPSMGQLQADRSRGFDVTGLLINTPAWAQATPAQGVHSPPAGLGLPFDDPGNAWGRYCLAMAKQYKGVVSSWIIWNEPDVWDPQSPFYTWGGDAPTYYQLLKVASQAIKSVDPNAQIVVGGMTFYWDANAGKPQFLSQVLDAAVADPSAAAHNYYFDAVAAHVYTTATNAYWVPYDFTQILSRHGMHHPIWIDEMNVPPYDDPAASLASGAPNATLAQQAAFMVEAYAEARAANVARLEVYKLQDGVPQAGAPYGLIRNDGSQRPAYEALQTVVNELAAMPEARMRSGQHHIAVEFVSGAHRSTVVWNTSPQPYTIALCALGTSARAIDAQGNARPLQKSGPGPGFYQLPLTPATAHGIFDGRDLYYIGGDPLIVEQEGVPASATCAPAVPHDARYFAQTGYRIDNDAFWAYFQARGGLATFGYPVSRTFQLLGFTTQLFQRQAMQLAPDGSVRLLNLLDPGLLPYTQFNGSSFPAADPKMVAAAPAAGSPGYADAIVQFVRASAPDSFQNKPTNFFKTFQGTVSLAQAFPNGGGSPALLPLLNLEVWGAPTSPPTVDPTNSNFIYQRFQRGVMHFDAACSCTQGILFGDYLKEILLGKGMPPDLAGEAEHSPLLQQYDPDSPTWRMRPDALPSTDLTFAFEKG